MSNASRKHATRKEKKDQPSPSSSTHHEIRLVLQRALRQEPLVRTQPHLQTHARIVRLASPHGRHHGVGAVVAGPHGLLAGAPRARALLRGQSAAEEEVEGAEDGSVGADDADVDFWSEEMLVRVLMFYVYV